MANTFYYGNSNTPADSTVKQVIIQGLPAEIRDESFLQLGDTISISFVYGNLVENPTIKLYNGSLDKEIGISGDSGHFIKTSRLNGSIKGLWNNGDICGFIYTIIGNTYYWILATDGIASEDTYGKVKIVNDIDDISEESKDTTAITVKAVEDLIVAQPIGQLSYNNAVSNSNRRMIGTLSFINGSDEVQQTEIFTFPEPLQKTHTHEFINDGEIEGGDKFLTRNIDTTITFSGENKGITVYDTEEEVEYLLYEPSNINNDATIKSLHDLNIEVENDLYIDAINININLDISSDMTSGADRPLYMAIHQLGWDNIIL